MERGRVRSACRRADPAAEEARREILRGAGAVLAAEVRGERGDEGEGDERGAGSGVRVHSDGARGARGSEGGEEGGECRAAIVGGVREEGVRGGPGAVREVRRGDEARGGGP